MQLDVKETLTEALLRQAVATGLMSRDGTLTDPEAQARLDRNPHEPVRVRGFLLRDVLSLRGTTVETMQANAAVARATAPRSRSGPSHPDAATDAGEAEATDDFTPPEEWVQAMAIPQAEVDAAVRLASPPELANRDGDNLRDGLLLALAARIETLEARLAALEGGA